MHNSMKLDNKNKTDVTGDNVYSHVSTTERYIIWGMFSFLYKGMLYLVIPQEEEKISTGEKKVSFYFIPWEKKTVLFYRKLMLVWGGRLADFDIIILCIFRDSERPIIIQKRKWRQNNSQQTLWPLKSKSPKWQSEAPN